MRIILSEKISGIGCVFYPPLITNRNSSAAMSGRVAGETSNYQWYHDGVLGEGAFGKVYRGKHKSKPLIKVAVKVCKLPTSIPHVLKVWEQEKKILTTIQQHPHKNIIGLCEIGRDLLSGNDVLVMEYCNGGNLLDYLRLPQNYRGLVDKELLVVMDDLTSGLEHMRQFDIIHRDIKPGNILRHIAPDGSATYKLTDFGSARHLAAGENYNSLCGTEAYLHPDVYEVCFFRKHTPKEFNANTELWSIGVTLYQLTTGGLPFYVGNRDDNNQRRTVLRIFDKIKETKGIISARQEIDSDEVCYSDTLPMEARLSRHLADLMRDLFVNLFNCCQSGPRWNFSDYRRCIRGILQRKTIKVFYVNRMVSLIVYIEVGFAELRREVSRLLQIPVEDQVYFVPGEGMIQEEDYPVGIVDEFFLCTLGDLTVDDGVLETGDDSDRMLLANAHVIKRSMLDRIQSYNSILSFNRCYFHYFRSELKRLKCEIEAILKRNEVFKTDKIVNNRDTIVKMLQSSHKMLLGRDADLSNGRYLRAVELDIDTMERIAKDATNSERGKYVTMESYKLIRYFYDIILRRYQTYMSKVVQDWFKLMFLNSFTMLKAIQKTVDSFNVSLCEKQNEILANTTGTFIESLNSSLRSYRETTTDLSEILLESQQLQRDFDELCNGLQQMVDVEGINAIFVQ